MYRSRFAFALAMAGLATILLPSSLTAQITFERTYGGTDYDRGESVQQTADSGYIITGYTWSFSAGDDDVWLIKTDARGDTLWTRTFGGSSEDRGYSVRQTLDGGYIIAGYGVPYGEECDDVYLIKTDASGDTLWTRTFGGTDYDEGYSVQQTTDSGYIVAGWSSTDASTMFDVYLIRIDARGDTLWTRTYGGDSDDGGNSVQQTADGGYIVAGCRSFVRGGPHDVWLLKTDASGDTLWTRTYGGTEDDVGCSVQQTADSGYIITGYTWSHGAGKDVYLLRTDANGDTLWTRTYGGTQGDQGNSVRQTADRGFIVTGQTYSFGPGFYDLYLLKTDARGDTLWTRVYGASYEEGTAVQLTSDGGYVITGHAHSPVTGTDVYLVKTDSLGNVAVAEPKTSPTRAPALSLSCEPNPCRGRTAISLQLTADSPAELAIFDATGRRVRTFTLNRTPYAVWDGRDDSGQPLPSGAYFLRLDAGSQHATARIVVQR